MPPVEPAPLERLVFDRLPPRPLVVLRVFDLLLAAVLRDFVVDFAAAALRAVEPDFDLPAVLPAVPREEADLRFVAVARFAVDRFGFAFAFVEAAALPAAPAVEVLSSIGHLPDMTF